MPYFRSISRIGKNAGVSAFCLKWGYFEGNKIVVDKKIKQFFKKFKI